LHLLRRTAWFFRRRARRSLWRGFVRPWRLTGARRFTSFRSGRLPRAAGRARRSRRCAVGALDASALENAGARRGGDRRLAAVLLGEQRAILAGSLDMLPLHRRRFDVTFAREGHL